MGALVVSPRKYLSTINGKSLEQCLDFVSQQASFLGVSTSSQTNLGEIIYNWAAYLANESKSSEAVFSAALSIVGSQDPHDAYKKVSKLNDLISGRKTLWDRLAGNDLGDVVAAITNHPFYSTFQEEGLKGGFAYVNNTYEEFKKIDKILRSVEGKLPELESKLRALKEPNLIMTNVFIPGDLSNNIEVATAIQETQKLIREKPELFFSSVATGALADAAAKEIYLLWKQSVVALDLSMSRWLTIGYMSLMLDAVVKNTVSSQAFAHMLAGSNDQMKQFGQLVSGVVK